MSTRTSLRRGAALPAATLLLLLALAPAIAGGGLVLSTPFPAVSVAPGTDVRFDITVSAAANTRVALSVSGTPEGWTSTLRGGGFVVDAVQTDAAGAATVELSVAVPADATAGTSRITVAGSGGGSASLPLDIRVSDEAAGAVTLDTDFPSLRGAAGTTFTFNLTLSNDTAEDQTFAVTAIGPDGWDVNATLTGQAQAASAVVEAGGTSGITVSAASPETVEAGTYPIQVRATVGEQTIDGELSVEITGTNQLTLTTPDGSLSNRGSSGGTITQQLVLVNDGTADLSDVQITATTPRDWTVTYDPADTLATLAAGESATVTASIVPSNDAVAGDYVVTFSAAGGDVSDEIEIRVTIETSPLWGFVGIGLIVAVLAGLWWVFRTYGRR
ncbi:MAG TPA: NEW3 domain-containing protein [Candidatus Limnocylindria bacterium]|nr:NEW3 domain-containing protein [Candidatus Limnocylindria bacterium]